MWLYFYIVALTAPSLGFGLAFSIAAILAILNQTGLQQLKRRAKNFNITAS